MRSHHLFPGSHAIGTERDRTGADRGSTLVELLLVILILGILAAGVLFAVSGTSTEAANTGCAADRRAVLLAAESYFAQEGRGGIPATGADHDRYEQTLVDGGYLRAASSYHDLHADGTIAPQEGSPC